MNTKHRVDYRHLTALSAFYPIHGPQMTHLALTVNPNSESEVKAAIRTYIVPHVAEIEKRLPGFTDQLKDTLRYYLVTDQFPIEEVYLADEPAFDLPDKPLDYYLWAWQVFFPSEDYRLASLDGYEEVYRGPP
jgi:hypothetical protein